MLSQRSITVDPIIFDNRRGRGREWQKLLLSLTRAIPPFIIISELARTARHGHSRSMNRETPNQPCNLLRAGWWRQTLINKLIPVLTTIGAVSCSAFPNGGLLQMQAQWQPLNKPKAHPCGVGIARITLCCSEICRTANLHAVNPITREPRTQHIPCKLGSDGCSRVRNETVR